ncbi:MAG: hypothetical protein LH702_17000, partial [Phormidesmis sp. CAN_BIN44]|nr:hypothetical protein [Phormidesmis sp. CAN_BIN44]
MFTPEAHLSPETIGFAREGNAPQLKNLAFQKPKNSCRIHRSDEVVPRSLIDEIRLRGLPSLV